MRTSPTNSALTVAMLAATPGLIDPIKSKKVDAGPAKYSFAPLNEWLPGLRRHLAEHGLMLWQGIDQSAVSPPLYWREERRGALVCEGHDPAVVLTTRITHGASGEWVESDVPVPLCYDSQDQGSALTYSRRYGIQTLLGLAPDDDDDGARRRRRSEASGRESAGQKMARQEEHDPEWEADRARFTGRLTAEGTNYPDVAAWLEAQGVARPSALGRQGRAAVVADVCKGGPRRVELEEWLAKRDADGGR